MRKRIIGVILMLLCAWTIVAHAEVYKCIAGGRIVYTDTPCRAGNQTVMHLQSPQSGSQPISGDHADNDSAQASIPGADTNNSKGIAAYLEQEKIDHQRSDLQLDIDHLKQQKLEMADKEKADLDQLREKKVYARNNLAGATYEESISQEMTARVAQYDSDERDLDSRIADLKAQIGALSKGNPLREP